MARDLSAAWFDGVPFPVPTKAALEAGLAAMLMTVPNVKESSLMVVQICNDLIRFLKVELRMLCIE